MSKSKPKGRDPLKAVLTADDKRRIINCHNLGMHVLDIARDFSCCKSTVYNVISEWRAHGDAAFADDKPAPAPTPAPTPETAEKKEPATAVAAVDPKKIVNMDSAMDIESTDSITQDSEKVKPFDDKNPSGAGAEADKPAETVSTRLIPASVIEACREKADGLYDLINVDRAEIAEIQNRIDTALAEIGELEDFVKSHTKNTNVEG